jgi:hypothetical protein
MTNTDPNYMTNTDPNYQRQERLKREFEGKTIERVEAPAINVVHFFFTDGSKANISVDETFYGIPVVSAVDWN